MEVIMQSLEDLKDFENKELCDAIREMIMDDNSETRQKMVDAVMKASFIAPVTFLDDEEVVYGQEQARKVNFDVLKNQDGKVMFPVYTDVEELKKAKKEEEVHTVITNVKTYATMFADPKCAETVNGIVINPMGMSLMLDKEFFDRVSNGGNQGPMTQRKFDKDTKFMFGEPKATPPGMIESLCEYLKHREEVQKAYLTMMKVNDERESILLVIDCEEKDMKSVFEGVGLIAAPFHKGIDLGMVPYNNEFGHKATERIQPFYTK